MLLMYKSPDIFYWQTLGVYIHIINFKDVLIELIYFFRCSKNSKLSTIVFKPPGKINYRSFSHTAWNTTTFKCTSAIGIKSINIISFAVEHIIFCFFYYAIIIFIKTIDLKFPALVNK